jgi:hypothetical protein
MIGPHYKKGQRQVPHQSTAHPEIKDKKNRRLAEYRAKSACMVHKAVGDPDEVCKDGLAVFDALAPARKRANGMASKDNDRAKLPAPCQERPTEK